ncbi:MAG: hypothetical protein HKN03_07690 [Acidimicrobiales bacterium]|nr:hypothetical protein [Acidimicrobiales bacterium]
MSLETMSEAISRLERAGYGGSFRTERGGLLCPACGGWHPASDIGIDEIVRFEGDSDPADEAILFALDCAHCESKGTYVSAYGPTMEPADVQVIRSLLDHRRGR